MKWQRGKLILPDSPARGEDFVSPSQPSATHPPKKTEEKIENKTDRERPHQHKWIVSQSIWKCCVCGETYG